jgi:hypothetical protein
VFWRSEVMLVAEVLLVDELEGTEKGELTALCRER